MGIRKYIYQRIFTLIFVFTNFISFAQSYDTTKFVLHQVEKGETSYGIAKKYNIDPNKIGLMGFSAGGAVTMEATYKSTPKNQPNFIAPIYPWMHIVEKQKVPQNKLNIFT